MNGKAMNIKQGYCVRKLCKDIRKKWSLNIFN